MRLQGTLAAIGAVAALVPAAAVARDDDRDRGPEFEGKVTRVDRANDRFRINDRERGSHRVYVNSRTRYERVAGLRGLRRGMKIEVTVRRSDGRWIATEVERRRPRDDDGRHGGDDDRPGDDD